MSTSGIRKELNKRGHRTQKKHATAFCYAPFGGFLSLESHLHQQTGENEKSIPQDLKIHQILF